MSLLTNPPSAAEVAAGIVLLDADLCYVFDNLKVPADVQAAVAHLGYVDLQVFSKIEDTPGKVREVIKSDVGLDPTASPAHRALMARLVVAWETAAKRVEKRCIEEADQRAGDLPRSLPKGSHLDLTRAFTKVHGSITDKLTPAPSYLEAKLEQVEDGELLAERMQDVMSKEEVEGNEAFSSFRVMPDGMLKVRKGRPEGAPPSKPEELRAKLRLMGHCWEFIRLKVPGKGYLADYDIAMWDRYADWLLGEEVYENVIKDDRSCVVFRPSWRLLLEYEFQVRKRMYFEVNNGGMTLKQALLSAQGHMPTTTKHFTIPVSLAAGSSGGGPRTGGGSGARSRSPPGGRPSEGFDVPSHSAHHSAYHARGPRGKGSKGGGSKSGNAKSKPRNNPSGGDRREKTRENPKTPDGRDKCYKFQRGNCPGNCGRVHTCLR